MTRDPVVDVPAALDAAEHLLGPLTVRQSAATLLAGLGLLLAASGFPHPTSVVLGGAAALAAVAAGFLAPGGEPPEVWLVAAAGYLLRHRSARRAPTPARGPAPAPGIRLLRPARPRYRLASPHGRAEQLGALAALLPAANGALQVCHAPVRTVPPEGAHAHVVRLTARARARVTLVVGRRLPDSPLLGPARCLPAWPAPAGEQVSRLTLADGSVVRVLALTRWPPRMPGDWLGEIAALPQVRAVCLHVDPRPAPTALRMLRRTLAGLLSGSAAAAARGERPDARAAAATAAALALEEAVASGDTTLVRVQVLLAVASPGDPHGLEAATRAVLAALAGRLALARTVTGRQAPAWAALRPGGAALPRPWRVMDATAAVAAWPHSTGTGGLEAGVLAGVDPDSGLPVLLDRLRLPNPARLVVGASGAGKSFAAKLEVLRWREAGARVVVVDPEGEFSPALAGRPDCLVLALGRAGGGLDPVGTACDPALSLAEGVALVGGVAGAVSDRPLSPRDLAVLEVGLRHLRAGRDHTPAALLAAVRAATGDGTGDGPGYRTGPGDRTRSGDLPDLLSAVVSGSIFAAQPDLSAPPPLVVFDCRDVAAGLRPAVAAAVLGWAWARARGGARPGTLLVVDEAHLLLGDPAAGELLAQFVRRARKYGVALEIVTQRLSDLLDTAPGRAVLGCVASLLLLGCGEPDRALTAQALGLSPAAANLLRLGEPGRGLLVAGSDQLPIRVVAGAGEHAAASTGPRP